MTRQRCYLATILERDIPGLGFRVDPRNLSRLLVMLAADQGQTLNASRLGEAIGVSHHAVRNWLDLLEGCFVIRQLPPCLPNLRKRMVKSPKVYIRDSGLLHAFLEIGSFEELLGRSVAGASWEGLVIENLVESLPGWRPSFYRSQDGAEIDLVLERGGRRIAVEAKASTAPSLTRGFYTALADLGVEEAYVAAPVGEAYPLRATVIVAPPLGIIESIGGSDL